MKVRTPLTLLFAVLLVACCAWAQEPVISDGRPALKFDTGDGWSLTVLYADYHGVPAFRFPMGDNKYGSPGALYVSSERVAYENSLHPATVFDRPRAEIRAKWDTDTHYETRLRLGHLYVALCERAGQTQRCAYNPALGDLLVRSIQDFDGTRQEFENRTASLRPAAPTAAAPQAEVVKPPPPSPVLAISVQPANVQVYVDDVFKGVTSPEGRLVVEGLAPGTHRVRLNLIGYTVSARTVELKTGETATIEAKLEPAGPKPLALSEIEEALTNGLPPKGITKLVNQYGVDFALTKEVEQRLRGKNADDALLVAIATGKK